MLKRPGTGFSFTNQILGVYVPAEQVSFEQPPLSARWTLISDIDNLTHEVMALYATYYERTSGDMRPGNGITLCGHSVVFSRGSGQQPLGGIYVPNGTVVTCIRCIGGDRTGEVLRHLAKQSSIGSMYGKGPPMQNITRPKGVK